MLRKCSICEREFAASYELNRHYTTGHPKMTRKEVKEMDERIKDLQFRIKMEWESYQWFQDEYRKLTGREYVWLR